MLLLCVVRKRIYRRRVMLILEYISTHHVTIYWPSEDCDGQVILTLHLSVGQVILFPYFDHWAALQG